MVADLDTTTRAVLECVCDALTEANRPACACYATIGPPVIGPAQCCSCDDGGGYSGPDQTTGELTIHVNQIYDASGTDLSRINPVHPCRNTSTAADLTVVLTRCYPRIGEDGNMPDTDDQDQAALDMHTDLETVWQALTCGCSDTRLVVGGVSVDSMPDAGCAVLAARITVEVRL